MTFTESDRQRFLAKVDLNGETGCWQWTAALDAKGYARFGLNGHNRKAARVAYVMFVGPIASELVPDHLCRNRACVNPAHLEAVTSAENTRRGFAARPPRTHCTKGHALAGVNTLMVSGRRTCRTCSRAYHRAWEERRRRSAGVPLSNAKKTHCKHGHGFTVENTYIDASGARQCRACRRATAARLRARRRAKSSIL